MVILKLKIILSQKMKKEKNLEKDIDKISNKELLKQMKNILGIVVMLNQYMCIHVKIFTMHKRVYSQNLYIQLSIEI